MKNFEFPVIQGLVARHATDSAFYWSQLDRSINSPQLGFERLIHFNRLLDAHLDGLRVAGEDGRRQASTALEKWQKAGEAFVCTWLSAHSTNEQALDGVLAQLVKRPDDLLRGAVSAIAWLPEALAMNVIKRWSGIPEPVAQVAALRAAALLGSSANAALHSDLPSYLSSNVVHVRAAACRAAVASAHSAAPILQPLRACLKDVDLCVRAEAAIALGQPEDARETLETLLACVIAQADVMKKSSGWYRKQASRRLTRWVGHLAAMSPMASSVPTRIFAELPARAALTFVLCHADSTHMPFVLAQMTDKTVSRYAGWVCEMLTGVSLANSGLTLPVESAGMRATNQLVTESNADEDNGLPVPDVEKIKHHMSSFSSIAPQTPSLLGMELNIANARELLRDAPQVIRNIAAGRVNSERRGLRIGVRAPVSKQYAAMASLDDFVDGTHSV